jgi:hypothetical protein
MNFRQPPETQPPCSNIRSNVETSAQFHVEKEIKLSARRPDRDRDRDSKMALVSIKLPNLACEITVKRTRFFSGDDIAARRVHIFSQRNRITREKTGKDRDDEGIKKIGFYSLSL